MINTSRRWGVDQYYLIGILLIYVPPAIPIPAGIAPPTTSAPCGRGLIPVLWHSRWYNN